jgi:hypothetical protein
MKKKPDSTDPETSNIDPNPKPARKHYPQGPVIIRLPVPADESTPAGWADVPLPEGTISGKRDARKYAQDHAFSGRVQVIEILDDFECVTTTQTVTTIK